MFNFKINNVNLNLVTTIVVCLTLSTDCSITMTNRMEKTSKTENVELNFDELKFSKFQ